MTLIDSNVILDVVTEGSAWRDWSLSALSHASDDSPLITNAIIYAEVSVRFASERLMDDAFQRLDLRLEPIRRNALFAAGKAFSRYREAKGPRESLLPDFFIGAHAQDLGFPLLTRDVRRYRTYFPDVRLITP